MGEYNLSTPKWLVIKEGAEMAISRFTLRDTPKGTTRTDKKTGKSVWRELGNPFPDGKKSKRKR